MEMAGAAARDAERMDAATLMRRWFEEVWNEGRAESIDELFPEHAVLWGVSRMGVASQGPAEFKEFHKALRAAFPDVHIELEDVVQEGDMAFARWTATMTHSGDGLGMAPTGRALHLSGMSALRVHDGKLVEGWNNWDQMGMARQLGVLEGKAAELFR
jgi:steroid delta-isomerase-like uncharacterized protein